MSNSGAPFYYDYINSNTAPITPSTIRVKDTGLYRYYSRYLMQKAMSVFEWQNIPDHWSKDYFLYSLYTYGYVAVIDTDKFGVIPQACGLSGYDVFYRPTHAVITNPLLKGITTPRIGTQCALIKLQPDFGGIVDIVSYYAQMLALTAETAATNILNSKLSYAFGANSKAGAESLKKLFDQIASGEPAVFYDTKLRNADGSPAWETFVNNVGQNYIATQLLNDLKNWENEFCTTIGIPNANTDKRERLITAEVESNSTDTRALSALWLDELRKGVEQANEMFGLAISVDFRESEVVTDAGNDVDTGSV